MNKYLASFLVAILLAGFTPSLFVYAATSQEERAALENQLADLEAQIAKDQATIEQYQKQGKTLTGEINSLNSKINKLNLQIKAINLSLTKLDKEIVENKSNIRVTEDKLELNKTALYRLIRDIYEKDRAGLVEVLLKKPRISDFFNNINSSLSIQGNLALTVDAIKNLRGKLMLEKEDLAEKRSDAARLKAAQNAQQKTLQGTKQEKATILAVTKGQESKYQDIVKQTKKTAAQIRSRLFELLGGGSLTFEKAYDFAKFAEQATGIRAAMILAVLDRESALGQNVGKCGYKTAMHPTRDTPIFLALVAALGINPDTITVSCANADGAYGGAMGPAQFIPSTWNLYKNKVADITGHNPASPWNNGDAFVATALYLKDASRGCDAIYSKQLDAERCAAAKYYAGGNWRRHLWGYGERVVIRAQQFQNDIDLLNS